jgi:hypothetical protein
VRSLFTIVEGHGDERAVPVLVRRLVAEIAPNRPLHLFPPYRIPRARLTKDDDASLGRALALARSKIRNFGEGLGAVLVLFDADGDCPAVIAPETKHRAMVLQSDVDVSVVVAKEEFEAWFLAGASSLRRSPRVRAEATAPAHPEAIRGAKEYLRRYILRDGCAYSETTDQPALASLLSLEEAHACRSFRKLRAALHDIAFDVREAPLL